MAAGLAALHYFLRELRHDSHNLPSNRITVLSPGGNIMVKAWYTSERTSQQAG
jgi:hypothetical protein